MALFVGSIVIDASSGWCRWKEANPNVDSYHEKLNPAEPLYIAGDYAFISFFG